MLLVLFRFLVLTNHLPLPKTPSTHWRHFRTGYFVPYGTPPLPSQPGFAARSFQPSPRLQSPFSQDQPGLQSASTGIGDGTRRLPSKSVCSWGYRRSVSTTFRRLTRFVKKKSKKDVSILTSQDLPRRISTRRQKKHTQNGIEEFLLLQEPSQ